MRRPNARISNARKRAAARRAGAPTLPPLVQARIAEAGASAYEWRDSILNDLYLPPKAMRVALRAGFWVLQAFLAVAIALVASQGGGLLLTVAFAVPVLFVALFYAVTRELTVPPAISWVAAAGVAAIPMISASISWGAIGVMILVGAVLISAEAEHPLRGEISAWASAILTVVFGALSHNVGLSWWPTAVWVVALVGVQVPICVLRRNFRSVGHRITPADLKVAVPDPEFRWQGLVETMRRVPGLGLLSMVVSSDGWLERVLDDPPGNVMAEARKKAAGAYGERKTGVMLLGLARGQGAMILHDVALPGAKSANIDHVVITKGRGGKPCAFIIDSKFYGPSRLPSKVQPEGSDPGEVTYDSSSRGYVHRLGHRARGIDQSIKTALWGADAVKRVTNIEDVRVVMAIHNADVAPHLSFSREGVPVEIISAWSLVGHIERESSGKKSLLDRLLRRSSGPLSPLQEARVTQGLSAASSSRKPSIYVPLGRTRKAGEFMDSMARQARGGVASAYDRRFGPPPSRSESFGSPDSLGGVASQGSVDPGESVNPEGYTRPRPQEPLAPVSSSVPEESAFEKADREFFDTDPSEWADDAPPRPPVASAQSAPGVLEGQWADMRNSVPAPLDDVPLQYHQVVRGTPLTITSFNEDRGPIAQDVVAITGVCVGAPGSLFLWYCSTEGWRQYKTSGTPVFISTIEVESVVVRDGGGE